MHLEAHSSVNEHGAFIYEAVRTLYENADPGPRDLCVCAMDKFTWTTDSCGGNGMAQPLSQGESTSEHLGHCLKRRVP